MKEIHIKNIQPVCPHPHQALATGREPLKPQMVGGRPQINWWLDRDHMTADMSLEEQRIMIRTAFEKLQPMMRNVRFVEQEFKASIVLKFMHNGTPGLPQQFQENVLAYAYFPMGESLGIHSDVFINDMYLWTDGWGPEGVNGVQTIAHEIGHALSFNHSDQMSSLMYFEIIRGMGNITEDMEKAAEKLYKEWWVMQSPPELPVDEKSFMDKLCKRIKELGKRNPKMVERLDYDLAKLAAQYLHIPLEANGRKLSRPRLCKKLQDYFEQERI